jgi:hypothetical protein
MISVNYRYVNYYYRMQYVCSTMYTKREVAVKEMVSVKNLRVNTAYLNSSTVPLIFTTSLRFL